MLGQGRPAAIAYLKENKKEAEKLEKEIREAWAQQKMGKEPLIVGEEEVAIQEAA